MARFTGTSGIDRYIAGSENVGFTITAPASPDVFIAGAGNDFISVSGSTSNTDLSGGAGLDALFGGAGNDRFLIGAPSELMAGEIYSGGRGLFGGYTFDKIVISSTSAAAQTYDFRQVNLINISGFDFSASPTAPGGARTVIFSSDQFEPVAFRSDFKLAPSQAVTGSVGNDTVIINIGTRAVDLSGWTFTNWTPTHDVLVVQGGAAADTIRGSVEKDEILAGNGNDTIFATAGNDIYNGQTGRDTAVLTGGTTGASVTLDASGNAMTNIGSGTISLLSIENLTGGDFNDQFIGNASANTLSGGFGDDLLQGRGGNDVLDGGSGNDNLQGGDGADQLFGSDDNDALFGDNGNDRLDGGFGNDTLNGGAGNDVFVIESIYGGGGLDRIVGFQDGLDRIELTGTSASSFAQLGIAQVGADTVVTYGGVNTITLAGIGAWQITAADFIF
jgi:Ca2+-binding RTX toxin-like protein